VTPAYQDWLRQFPTGASQVSWKATLGQTVVQGNTATVEVIIESFRPNGPFGNPVQTFNTNYFLRRVGDTWQLIPPADIYWLY